VANKLVIDNEPAFLVPYLFNYVSRPDLTSKYVRHISGTEYTMTSYPGDDDSGAMSSWYIFSKIGFFPVAGQDIYLINGPSYKKVTLQMENGKKIEIFGNNASPENQYVESVTLNGKQIAKSWFKHGEIKNGAKFYFDMSPVPTKWGFDAPVPPSY